MPRHFTLLFALIATAVLVRAETSNHRQVLLDGKDFAGWKYVTPSTSAITDVCHYNSDGSLSVAGHPKGYLVHAGSYRNFRLHVEWCWAANAAKNSNSGILVLIASGPKDREWPLSLQIQTKPGRAGDILPMAGATFAEKLSTPPDAKVPQLFRSEPGSEKAVGQWNECDVVCRDGTLEVSVNGVVQNRVTHVSPGSGKVGLQLEGTPYAVRNVWIERLD
ncbi:MAG TPA: DUF1080 domain-containing protein [Opitutaceae bacterium]|nr:DUF1080 domain-containing protein [Opitutaceae bacterium]